MFGQATSSTESDPHAIPRVNPFVDQFSRYFPDLRVQRVNAGHFFPEEAPDVTNAALLRFLAGERDSHLTGQGKAYDGRNRA
jgi:hypothetical protein